MLNRVLALIASLILSSQLLVGQSDLSSPRVSFLTTPLAFTINEGQWNESARFSACSGGATFWFMSDRVVYQFVGGYDKADTSSVTSALPDSVVQQILTASFPGSNPDAELMGDGMTTHISNYFLGNDPSKWHTDVPNYSAIVYREMYPGIDLRYFGNGKMLEYDFIISPGADPSQIAVRYDGATDLFVNEAGELEVETTWGRVVEHRPQVYQLEGESRIAVACKYQLIDANTFTFELPESYNPQLALVIDPVLYYSTYLGGLAEDLGQGITVDASGFAYVTGYTNSANFPNQGPYQTDQGTTDVFVSKLSAAGNTLIYSTYIGGSGQDWGSDVVIDGSGSAHVVGYTASSNFPTLNQFQSDQGNYDAFVTKLGPLGNSLFYSTYLGGSGVERAYSIAIDESGNTYVTGLTASTNFPTMTPFQTDQSGDDAFVTKLSSTGSSLIYSTYLGGTGVDYGYGVAVDENDNAYVTGGTASTNFPTMGPYQGDQAGTDAFVAKLSPAGSSIMYSTYLGGSADEFGEDIAVGSDGSAYITGGTGSADFPLQNHYQTFQGSGDAFVTRLSSAGSSLEYSTFIGGSGSELALGIAINSVGCAFITGYTQSADFPTLNPYQLDQGGEDAFITALSPVGSTLIYSTYIGGSAQDQGADISLDGMGGIYMTGFTVSGNFPTQNPFETGQGIQDVIVTKLFDLESNLWSFPNTETNMWPSSWWSHNNYCQSPTPCSRNCQLCDESEFPDWTAYKAAIGDSLTYFDPLTKNHLRPSAITKWRAIQRPWEGSCFGFAASNILVFDNNLSVPAHFPGHFYLNTVPIDSASRSLINKFALYQYGAQQQSTIASWFETDLNAVASSIESQLSSFNVPLQVLMMFKCTGPGAHAVIPFHTEHYFGSPFDSVLVSVYDSNLPGTPGVLKFTLDPSSTGLKFWEYRGIPGWAGISGIIPMDPASNYLKPLVISDTLNGGINNYVQLFVGDNDSTNIDGVLGTIGHNSDSLYNTVTGAVPMTPATGTAILPIGYFLPEGAWTCRETGESDFPIWIVDGDQATFRSGGAKSGIISAAAQVYSYNAVTATFGLTGANTALKSPNVAASYDVQTIAIEADSEVVYLFEGIEVAFGDTVFFQLQSDNKLKVSNCGDLTNYDLQIEVMNAVRDTSFYYSTVTLASNSAHLISANWRENNDSLLIQVATGGCSSGIFNSTIKVPNEGVPPDFVCGDANGSGAVSISDVVFLINYIFSGGPAPNPLASADANCSGGVNISDAVYLINYIFSGGAAPCAACK